MSTYSYPHVYVGTLPLCSTPPRVSHVQFLWVFLLVLAPVLLTSSCCCFMVFPMGHTARPCLASQLSSCRHPRNSTCFPCVWFFIFWIPRFPFCSYAEEAVPHRCLGRAHRSRIFETLHN